MENALPPIPARRYFTLDEAAELCGATPGMLRGWEQRFAQGAGKTRRHYQRHELLTLRRIRSLELRQDGAEPARAAAAVTPPHEPAIDFVQTADELAAEASAEAAVDLDWLRAELLAIRKILTAE